ncbi:MAG: twin-arginine translocation pathway signal protein [Phycisphaerales bacterium]
MSTQDQGRSGGGAERIVPAMNRRDVLRVGSAGALVLAGLGGVRRAMADTPTPSLTEGPYWVEEMLNRADVRSDPATGAVQQGLPLRLMVSVSRLVPNNGVPSPVVGAYVDIWHCNSAGAYSDVAANSTSGQKWLRGYQVTDSHGMVRFLTVYPGWYQGRAVHIHVRVRQFTGTTVTFNYTTQFFFNDTISNAIYHRVAPYTSRPNQGTLNTADGIFNSAGSQMILRMADDGSHAIASFNIKLNVTGGLVHGVGKGGAIIPNEEDHADEFGGGTPPLKLRIAQA